MRTRRARHIINFQLLIEPVWNRNLGSLTFLSVIDCSFNRTSMESKFDILEGIFQEYFELLIEPVWNRNFFQERIFFWSPSF